MVIVRKHASDQRDLSIDRRMCKMMRRECLGLKIALFWHTTNKDVGTSFFGNRSQGFVLAHLSSGGYIKWGLYQKTAIVVE